MAEKKVQTFNFSLPQELAEEFRRIGDVHGERNKLRYAVAGAAVLKLLEMPAGEMQELISQVYGARHFPGMLSRMIDAAKAKADPASPPRRKVEPFADLRTKKAGK